MNLNDDDLIFAYKNECIYKRDLDIIINNQYINDSILSTKYLILLDKIDQNSIKIFGPMTIQAFRYDTDAPQYIDDFNPFEAEYVLLPNTDSKSFSDTGGHWSLILWKTNKDKNSKNMFYHFDSHNSYNENSSYRTVVKLCELFNVIDFEFLGVDSPQQKNSYDCGIFVIMFIEYLLKNNANFSNIVNEINQDMATKYRKDLYHEFIKLGEEYNKKI